MRVREKSLDSDIAPGERLRGGAVAQIARAELVEQIGEAERKRRKITRHGNPAGALTSAIWSAFAARWPTRPASSRNNSASPGGWTASRTHGPCFCPVVYKATSLCSHAGDKILDSCNRIFHQFFIRQSCVRSPSLTARAFFMAARIDRICGPR